MNPNEDHCEIQAVEPPKVSAPQRPHRVTATWRTCSSEIDPVVHVECPYEPGDHDKPCRLWTDEYGFVIPACADAAAELAED